jgi:hypothetical protein
MGLFRRKQREERFDERCPNCREPVPEGAIKCTMCGIDLRPLRGSRGGDVGISRKADVSVR